MAVTNDIVKKISLSHLQGYIAHTHTHADIKLRRTKDKNLKSLGNNRV